MSKKDKIISVRFTLKDYIDILQECESNDCSITDVIMNGVRAKEELTKFKANHELICKSYEEKEILTKSMHEKEVSDLKERVLASESNIKKANKSESLMTEKVKELSKELNDLKQSEANLSDSTNKKVSELNKRLSDANEHLEKFRKWNSGLIAADYNNNKRKMPDKY